MNPTIDINSIQRTSNGLSITLTVLETAFNNEANFTSALCAAVQETVQVIAATIINERRAEIEAACNFEGLREAVASELVRQFMTARLMGQTTPFDKAPNNAPSYQSGQLTNTTGPWTSALQGSSKP